MGAIRQPGEYVANTWRISDVVVAATTVTGVATTRGDRDSNCDRGDGFRHPSHSFRNLVTVVVIPSRFVVRRFVVRRFVV